VAGRSAPSGDHQVSDSERGAEQSVIGALRAAGVSGAALLQVGASSPTDLRTLLNAGVTHAVVHDPSDVRTKSGSALLEEWGLFDRVEWHTGEYLESRDRRPADVVLLSRVGWYEADLIPLVDVAALRSRRLLAMSFPRRSRLTRIWSKAVNGYLRLRRRPVWVFVHTAEAIDRRVLEWGFEEVASGDGAVWAWRVWQRV
jgi:hypothetical protein